MNYFALVKFWQDRIIESYYKMRYSHSWRWYQLNWEENGEFLP
jgi:hypothetical protein